MGKPQSKAGRSGDRHGLPTHGQRQYKGAKGQGKAAGRGKGVPRDDRRSAAADWWRCFSEDPRRRRFPEYLDEPRIIQPPTIMQVFPHNWEYGRDSPCYLILGNWLDGTTDEFMTKYNIVLVMRVAGYHPSKGYKPPENGYGTNRHTGCQPVLVECPLNHKGSVVAMWLEMCDACNTAWRNARPYQIPPAVFVHCNVGHDRGPAWMCLLASKLMGCQPTTLARRLSTVRMINPMYSGDTDPRSGRDLTAWNLMKSVHNVEPHIVPFRTGKHYNISAEVLWIHVPDSDRVDRFRPDRVRLLPRAAVVNPVAEPQRHEVQSCAYTDIRNMPTVTDEDRKRFASLQAGSRHDHEDKRTRKLRYDVPERNLDDDDENDVDDQLVGNPGRSYFTSRLQAYLNRYFHGELTHNGAGRHVCHEIAEGFRSGRMDFDMQLMLDALWATRTMVPGGLEVRTIGDYPPRATILSAVCKQEWMAMGCQPSDQPHVVGVMLEWGCDPNSRGPRGDTVMMEMAGAGNVPLFGFIYKRIVKYSFTCDLDATNVDGRNLWSIAGLAHEDARSPYREFVNVDIKNMLRHLGDLKLMQPSGLATHSKAGRPDKRPRVEDSYEAAGVPLELHDRSLSASSESPSKRLKTEEVNSEEGECFPDADVESECSGHVGHVSLSSSSCSDAESSISVV